MAEQIAHNILAVDVHQRWRDEVGHQLETRGIPHLVVESVPFAEIEIGSGLYSAVFAGDMHGDWKNIAEPTTAFGLPLILMVENSTRYAHAINDYNDVLRIKTWKNIGSVVGDALDLLAAQSVT
jgi:hypothetical protein